MALVAMGITTELTATLMLSPLGTRTLATEFWSRTAEFDHVGAAPYALAMILLHPLAVWLVALLVTGQGLYFFWREWTARRAPNAEAARHARPTRATVNAGWASIVVAILVWSASFRGVLG
jgi:ABC-type Fe3+ transport system permease subunit